MRMSEFTSVAKRLLATARRSSGGRFRSFMKGGGNWVGRLILGVIVVSSEVHIMAGIGALLLLLSH